MTEQPHEGDEYQHEDGTHEVVFAVESGRILTVREYPDVAAFRDAIETADPHGTNPLVEELSVDLFSDEGD